MQYIVTNNEIKTQLGTVVPHDGSAADKQRATALALDLDARKTAAANARAKNDGTANGRALTVAEVATGSHSRESWPVGVRIGVEAAEKALRSNNPALAVNHLQTAVDLAKAKLAKNAYSDRHGRIAEEIKLAESLRDQFAERARFLSESRPAQQPVAPTVPVWIEQQREEIRADWNLTPSQKRARLEGMDRIEAEKQAEIDAEQSRKATFDRSEFTGAKMDAELSVTLAELASDLPEEFVIGARQRLERLKETGDDISYRAETAVAESRQLEFRSAKKEQREAQAKAEREATGAPEPLPSPGA